MVIQVIEISMRKEMGSSKERVGKFKLGLMNLRCLQYIQVDNMKVIHVLENIANDSVTSTYTDK